MKIHRLALILAAALVPSLSSATGAVIAAVPLRWTVETSRVQPAVFDAYQGETLTFEAALQSKGKKQSSKVSMIYFVRFINSMDNPDKSNDFFINL